MANLSWLYNNHYEAFVALPGPYQADSCLDFFEEMGSVYACPTDDQLSILGDWLMAYYPEEKAWKQTGSIIHNCQWLENNHLIAFDAFPEHVQIHLQCFFWKNGKLKTSSMTEKVLPANVYNAFYDPIKKEWVKE